MISTLMAMSKKQNKQKKCKSFVKVECMAELLHYIADEVSGECISFWGKQDSTTSNVINSKTICSIHNIAKHKQSRFSGLHFHLMRGQNHCFCGWFPRWVQWHFLSTRWRQVTSDHNSLSVSKSRTMRYSSPPIHCIHVHLPLPNSNFHFVASWCCWSGLWKPASEAAHMLRALAISSPPDTHTFSVISNVLHVIYIFISVIKNEFNKIVN